MKHIFIAYSPKDMKPMILLRDVLLQAGFKPWIDPAPQPGMDWRFDIDDAIRAADLMLLVITPASADSIYVTYEWALALGMNIPVIPIIFRPTKLHPRLSSLLTFDMNAWKDERQFWDYFTRELRRLTNPPAGMGTGGLQPASEPMGEPTGTKLPLPPVGKAADRSIMPLEAGHWLVIRRGPHLNTMFRLDRPVISLGRDANNDITINDGEVSRYHLRFVQKGTVYSVEDLGSTNGTVVNGKRINGLTPLSAGSTLMLGDTVVLSYEVIV